MQMLKQISTMAMNTTCKGNCWEQIRMDVYEKYPDGEWCDCTLQECSACHVEHPGWYFRTGSVCKNCIAEEGAAGYQVAYKQYRKQRSLAFFASKKDK